LENISADRSSDLLANVRRDQQALEGLLAAVGEAQADTDRTDGLRVFLTSGRIAHARASGQALELRLYV
jgi:phosphomannomutase